MHDQFTVEMNSNEKIHSIKISEILAKVLKWGDSIKLRKLRPAVPYIELSMESLLKTLSPP